MDEVVLVRLGGSRLALPLAAVAEVGRPPALTRVPGLPTWVAGVANWRGRVLAVLDLRSLIGDGRPPGPAPGSAAREARLVVLQLRGTHGEVRVGLLVERVDGTTRLEPDRLEPTSPHLPARSADLLAGQVTDADGPLGVVDPAAVLALADRLSRTRRAS